MTTFLARVTTAMTNRNINLPPMPKPSDFNYDPGSYWPNQNAKAAYEQALKAWQQAVADIAKGSN